MWSADGTHDDRKSVFSDWMTHADMTNVLCQLSLIAAPTPFLYTNTHSLVSVDSELNSSFLLSMFVS